MADIKPPKRGLDFNPLRRFAKPRQADKPAAQPEPSSAVLDKPKPKPDLEAHQEIREKIQAEVSGSHISIVSLISLIVELAYHSRASDVHIDPYGDHVRFRLRIDGTLQDEKPFPSTISSEIISRIKILSSLRTDEHQSAQDGRFRVEVQDVGPVDVRVSITPTYYGENAVMRLLAEDKEEFSLNTLGFSQSDQDKIIKAISKPYGMILSTGPTGSGKTTTLYSIIKSLNDPSHSIITIEDPIEYAVAGIVQIGVNNRAGLSFANGLRSILRQDPDIIMVGEIRDKETAGLAVNTALTGHLLLSTIHTNDAATTLPRLLDMGLEPYLLASTVNVAIGQRLIRKICKHCKQEKKLTALEQKSLNEIMPGEIGRNAKFYHGTGCDKCNDSGYRGRISINEVMVVDTPIREAILRKASAEEIKKVAVKSGMTTMLEDGLDKAQAGITTLEEVLRILHE